MANSSIPPKDRERIQQYWNAESTSAQISLAAVTTDILAWLIRKGFQEVANRLVNNTVDRILEILGLRKPTK